MNKDASVKNVAAPILNVALGSFFTFGVAAAAVFAVGQSPQPSPSPKDNQSDFEVTASVEAGVRGLELNGSESKFRSDFNYRSGLRVFDSSFLIEDKTKGVKLFDTLLITSSGFGADPAGFFRASMEKVGIYRLESNVRTVKYFSNLSNIALGEHTANTRHNFGDFDLTVFPQSEDLRFRLGYSFNDTDGTGGFTTRAYGDEFPVTSFINSRSSDIRVGIEGKLLGFNLSLSQGYRKFTDDTRYILRAPNLGNNPTNTARLETFQRNYPTEGNSYFTVFNAQRTFANRIDFTGRLIYSSTDTNFQLFESITGRDNSNNNVDLDQFEISGDSKRPQARGDLGVTFKITKDFRISETSTYDQFNISGGNRFFEQLTRRNNAGNPLATVFTNTLAHRVTSFKRVTNTIEADYQFNNYFAFSIGHRFTDRRIVLAGFDLNLASANPTLIDEEFDNRTNALIAGLRAKPLNNWTIYADVEHGEADNVFTRLSNNKFTNFRVRSRLNFSQFSINLSAISKDNNNPSRSIEIPPRDFSANVKTRIFSAALEWSQNQDFSLGGGYNFQFLRSEADIIVPLNNIRTAGISQFFMRDNYFFFDIFSKPIKRVSLYASYRINKDAGQGNRISTAPQNIFSSYPFQLQMPEIRLAIRLTRNIDWSVGYQYYDYKDNSGFNQNYRAHLPYTSLKIYFGRSAGDR